MTIHSIKKTTIVWRQLSWPVGWRQLGWPVRFLLAADFALEHRGEVGGEMDRD